jgi:hypothetical protein
MSYDARATCRRKVKYRSEAFARVVGQNTLAKEGDEVKTLFPYQCPVCDRWHLSRTDHTGIAPVTLARAVGVVSEPTPALRMTFSRDRRRAWGGSGANGP